MTTLTDDLASALRRSAKSGKLNHLSIAYTADGWDVRYRGVEDRDHRKVVHSDPAAALYEALTGKRLPESLREALVKETGRKARSVTPVSEKKDDDVLEDL